MTQSKLLLMAGAIGAAGLLAAACTPKESAEAPTAAESGVPAGIHAPLSVNELMVMIVDVPGEHLWDVEKSGHAPTTDEAWYQLENHAVELVGAATLIKLGGTGPNDMGWAGNPQWQSTADQLVAAAESARAAAKAKDMDALVMANGAIVDACEACHKTFKPDIPTGGLFLHPMPDA